MTVVKTRVKEVINFNVIVIMNRITQQSLLTVFHYLVKRTPCFINRLNTYNF